MSPKTEDSGRTFGHVGHDHRKFIAPLLHRAHHAQRRLPVASRRGQEEMKVLVRLAVEEQILKDRRICGRDLVNHDDEISSGDLLILGYECLPLVSS